ncbi:MAG: DoxX family protein [Tepidisphaeraceae bacterium]
MRCSVTCYDWVAAKIDLVQPVFMLLIRLYIGYQSAVSGWAHLTHVDQTADFFKSLNIPMPRLNVYIAGSTEVIGGILIGLGLASRLVAIPFVFNFLIAMVSVDLADPTLRDKLFHIWRDQDFVLKDDAFPFFFVGLMVLIFGPGKLSLDYLVRRFWESKVKADEKKA